MVFRFMAFCVALGFSFSLAAAASKKPQLPFQIAQIAKNARDRTGQSNARAARRASRSPARPSGRTPRRISEATLREKLNEWVVGVAAGKLEGAPIQLVEEMSRVLDDGDNMQVLPIITRGPSYNVHALLYLRGIDLAVINGDVLDFFGKKQNIPRIRSRINFITQLFTSELHILARPEIKTIEDLAGKAVNFNTIGTSAAFTGPIIFDRLGIKIKKTFVPHPIAMQQMKKSDKYAAVVFVTAKPVRPLVKKKWPKGFKLLPAPFTPALEDLYLPGVLNASDYPDLIKPGQRIDTVAVPTVLAAFNWSSGHPRQRKVSRFVDYLFERFARLRKPPFHKKWRTINLAADIPGWKRLPAVEEKLKTLIKQRQEGPVAALQARAARVLPGDPVERKRLFDEFLKWYGTQKSER